MEKGAFEVVERVADQRLRDAFPIKRSLKKGGKRKGVGGRGESKVRLSLCPSECGVCMRSITSVVEFAAPCIARLTMNDDDFERR